MSGPVNNVSHLLTLKCYHCVSAESLLGYFMLPSDCIPSPEIKVSFVDEDNRDSVIQMRVVCGVPEIFVMQSALIKADTTRHNNLYKHPVYKKGRQSFYRVDKELIQKLRSKQSKVAACAIKRLEDLQENVDINASALIRAYNEKIQSCHGDDDIAKIISLIDWGMQALSTRGVLQKVFESQAEKYGLSTASPIFHSVPDPNSRIYEYRGADFWDSLFVEARGLFGVKDPDQFKRDQILGKRRHIAKEVVPHRPGINNYLIHFPDSHVWARGETDSRPWNTINRILWEAEMINPSAAATFASKFGPDVLEMIGYNRPYIRRTEKNGRTGLTRHVDALDLLRYGFYSALVHLCTHQTGNFRVAFMDKNSASLTTKLLECHKVTDAERSEIHFLNVVYKRLIDAATRNISVKQISRTAIKDGLPSAFEVLCFMHSLDVGTKTKETKMILCFLGLSYFCGFRSSDMGRLMIPDFKAEHTGHHNMLVTDDQGRMWMGTTKCKINSDDLKVLVLPDWLKGWVEDWVDARNQFAVLPATGSDSKEPHSGMWLTATGKPVHFGSGGCANKASNFEFVFDTLHEIAPNLNKVTCFTDLRSIFFEGTSVQVSGSMMNLFANAQEYLPAKKANVHAGLRTDVMLPMQDDVRSAMETLNRSKSQHVYTSNRVAPLPFVAEYYDAVKTFVWANISDNNKNISL